MNFEQATEMRQDLEYLIGRKVDNQTIDDIVVAPADGQEFDKFSMLYLRTKNGDIAIHPFKYSELTVEFIYDKKYIGKGGFYLHGQAVVGLKKLGNIDLNKYGIS